MPMLDADNIVCCHAVVTEGLAVASTTVSFINMKGGVGKTTLAFNIAHYAAQVADPPLKVLAIDLDPQANFSQCLMGAADYLEYVQENNPTTAEMFGQAMPPGENAASAMAVPVSDLIVNIRPRFSRTLDLVPSRLELAHTLRNPVGKEEVLARFIATHAPDYDLIIIDCAPTESVLTTAAYRASRYLIVPVRPEFLATVGFPMLARSLDEFRAGHQNQSIDIAGIVFMGERSDPPWQERKAVDDVRGIADRNGWRVFSNQIFDSRSYPNGSLAGHPIFRTPHSRGSVVQEFYGVAEEFLDSVRIQ